MAPPSVLSGPRELRALAARLAGPGGIRILAIGSSSTEGVGASSPAQTYPRQLESTLRSRFAGEDITVQNAGIGGETADAAVLRLEEALRGPLKPDLVIWQVGTNDALNGGDEDRFRGLLARGVAAALAAGVDLILLDQQFYPAIPDPARYERYVRTVGSVAAAAGVTVFSRYAMMKSWHASDPDLLSAMLSNDRFHMSDRGYRCLAQVLGSEITSAIGTTLASSTAPAQERHAVRSTSQAARRF